MFVRIGPPRGWLAYLDVDPLPRERLQRRPLPRDQLEELVPSLVQLDRVELLSLEVIVTAEADGIAQRNGGRKGEIQIAEAAGNCKRKIEKKTIL